MSRAWVQREGAVDQKNMGAEGGDCRSEEHGCIGRGL